MSLVYGDSPAGLLEQGSTGSPRAGALRWRGGVCALALLGSVLACGDEDGDGDTVALADSGSLSGLTNGGLAIPTTVAVRNGVAWIAESQFDHYAPFGGDGMPGAFRIVGVPLNGGELQFISLPPNFFPEGITATPGGQMFIGSVANGAIYTIDRDATEARVFITPGTLSKPSVLGMTVSNQGDLLWVCNTVTTPPDGEFASGDIIGIGIADRQVKATHSLPPSAAGAFCNDLVMDPNGNLWATESFGGRIFRVLASELLTDNPATQWVQAAELSPPPGGFGVNGLTLAGGRLFVVNSSSGFLLSIDPALEQPTGSDFRQVSLTEGGADVVLANPDGVTRVSDTELLIVENGLGLANGKRVVRVRLGQ